jgi:hypothetical protein
MAFGIGGEYLAKGAYLLYNPNFKKQPKDVIRPPNPLENTMEWAKVLSRNNLYSSSF